MEEQLAAAAAHQLTNQAMFNRDQVFNEEDEDIEDNDEEEEGDNE